VNAFLKAGLAADCAGPVYNVSATTPQPLIEIAQTIAQLGGAPSPRLVPFPSDRLAIDIGSFHSSSEKFHREFDWSPAVDLETGLRSTLDFFQKRRASELNTTSASLPR
jgi:UDP-glucose 4-epimerase